MPNPERRDLQKAGGPAGPPRPRSSSSASVRSLAPDQHRAEQEQHADDRFDRTAGQQRDQRAAAAAMTTWTSEGRGHAREHPPRREPRAEHQAGDGGLVGEFGHEDQAEDRRSDGEANTWARYQSVAAATAITTPACRVHP